MSNPPTSLATLSNALTTSTPPLPTPTSNFLTTILTPTSQTKPLAVLSATAKHRLLSSNISDPSTSPVSSPPNAVLPPTLLNLTTPQSTILNDTFVQILDILDISLSKWEQIERLEAERKGELTKGREIIRVVPDGAGDGEMDLGSSAATQLQPNQTQIRNQNLAQASRGPHKVLMQDVNGTQIWGFELKRVDKLGIPGSSGGGINIGCKMWLKRGCQIARGMVLLEPGTCVVLGGKSESLDKAWREGREQRLRSEIAREPERSN